MFLIARTAQDGRVSGAKRVQAYFLCEPPYFLERLFPDFIILDDAAFIFFFFFSFKLRLDEGNDFSAIREQVFDRFQD